MNLQKPKQTRIIGSVASLALLLALTGCGSGGEADIGPEVDAKGPPLNSNSPNAGDFGASIAVSNTCELADTDTDGNPIKPVLRVTTTITDKSSGDLDEINFDYATVTAMEKGKGKGKYEQVGVAAMKTGDLLGVTKTDIQLCTAEGAYLGPDDTVSLNASVSVSVINDNKPEYANRCSDDPDTDGINEGKVVVSSYELNQLCGY